MVAQAERETTMQASYTPHIREIGTTGRFRLSVPARPLTLDELQRLARAATVAAAKAARKTEEAA